MNRSGDVVNFARSGVASGENVEAHVSKTAPLGRAAGWTHQRVNPALPQESLELLQARHVNWRARGVVGLGSSHE
jgi:hypothetical protein